MKLTKLINEEKEVYKKGGKEDKERQEDQKGEGIIQGIRAKRRKIRETGQL